MTATRSLGSQADTANGRLQRLPPRQRVIAERCAKGLTYKHIATERDKVEVSILTSSPFWLAHNQCVVTAFAACSRV